MHVYTPASFSVTSVMVRLSDSRTSLETEFAEVVFFSAVGLQTYEEYQE